MIKRNIFKLIILIPLLCCGYLKNYAQDCTVNAGGNSIICGSAATLSGGVAGNTTGTPLWTFISGPATPVIATPNALTTNVTGMTVDGNYLFQLSHPCGTGTATSQVTITAHPRPASFTAGTDITTICATTGTTPLAGVIPAGFTGQWRSVNIFNLARFNTQVSTNSQFSSTTVANPTFSLINKSNHEIDPAYYAILKITSLDGNCSYEDTTIVRFVPNPQIVVVTNWTKCRTSGDTRGWIDNQSTSPAFSTSYAGSAGTPASGTNVILNVNSQPSGASMSFDYIESRRIYFNGMNVDGTYTFSLTITNSCGTYTTPLITFTYSGTTPEPVSFTLASQPEQWQIYDGGNSGGELHCSSMAGTTTPENFYFTINPADPPTVITTVTPSGIQPPGGAPTVSVAGAGTYDRVATVTPPSGGWRVGTYKFTVITSNGSCTRNQSYYIHISDGNRANVVVPDQSVCYPGTGAISATIPLPAVYKGVVNSSYLQDYDPNYTFSVISMPSGAANPTYTSANLRNISSTSTQISNLNRTGDYVFRITLANYTSSVGPFFAAEYACSGTSYVDTFTIHVENPVNANAGSDQTGVCSQTVNLLGNNPGAGTGTWQLVSAPPATSPVITAPNSFSTTATNLNAIGEYRFKWSITSPMGGCMSNAEVSYFVTCALPVRLSAFNAIPLNGLSHLKWMTSSEQHNKGFDIERSTDGKSWNKIGFVPTKAYAGNSSQGLNYEYIDAAPINGANYYRLKQTDLDGLAEYSPVRILRYETINAITIHPNPAKEKVNLSGLQGNETITLYDVMGRTLISQKAINTGNTLDVKQLEPGVYYIGITSNEGKLSTYKLLKH